MAFYEEDATSLAPRTVSRSLDRSLIRSYMDSVSVYGITIQGGELPIPSPSMLKGT